MYADYMIFAALTAVPISAMLCSSSFLYFFVLFPAAALAGKKWNYYRRLLLLSIPPALMLVWSLFSGNNRSAVRSLRWICAVASGTYFATALGSGGIAMVLKSIPFTGRLSDLLFLAGSTASTAGTHWKRNSDMPLAARIIHSAGDSVEQAESIIPERAPACSVPFSVAIVSWLFLLVSVSGIADGLVK